MQNPPRGGWHDFSQMKPAAEYDIRYGNNLVKATSGAWPSYIAVSTPTAYKAAEPNLTRKPETVVYAKEMDFG